MFRAKLLRVKFGRNSARRQIVIFLKLRMANIWRGARENRIDFPRSELESLSGTGRWFVERARPPRFSPIFTIFHQPNTRRGRNGRLLWIKLETFETNFCVHLLPLNRFFFVCFIFVFASKRSVYNIALTRCYGDVRIREILKARLVLIRITWGVFKLFE